MNETHGMILQKLDEILNKLDQKTSNQVSNLFDGNPEVITMIGCVTSNRLCESPPPGKCKHNELVVFDC